MKHFMDEIAKNVLYYEAAKKQLEIYIDNISNEYKILNDYNPINHKEKSSILSSILRNISYKVIK